MPDTETIEKYIRYVFYEEVGEDIRGMNGNPFLPHMILKSRLRVALDENYQSPKDLFSSWGEIATGWNWLADENPLAEHLFHATCATVLSGWLNKIYGDRDEWQDDDEVTPSSGMKEQWESGEDGDIPF